MVDPKDEHREPYPIDDTQETVILPSTTRAAVEPGQSRPQGAGDQVKYEIIRKLGKGGFAWVYLVRNLDLDRYEAMKILNADLTEDETIIDNIVKEARISANFHHQNIVTIFEVRKRGYWHLFKAGDDEVRRRHREPFAFFTMSFIEGQTATALLRKEQRISQKSAVRIALDACTGLDYAHGKGIIHRDIKPDNIMVDRQGNGILMDFGIAKVVDQTRQTAAGTFMGTARYVSPEQAGGLDDIDGRTDLYSLGVTLYEMITGRVPFTSDQWMTVLFQHINESPPPPEKFCADLNRDLRSIILKMLEKKREDRFHSAREAGDALSQVYLKLGGEERHTLPLDLIKTRRDYEKGDATEVTEPARRSGQPSDETPIKGERPPVRAKIPKKKLVLPIWGVAAIVVVVALLGYILFPRKEGEQKQVNPTPVSTGRLHVSAFPRGRLQKIEDENGKNYDIPNPVLPRMLILPAGTYELTITYRGHTRTTMGFISPGLPLSKANVEFELEDDLFLLEDLR